MAEAVRIYSTHERERIMTCEIHLLNVERGLKAIADSLMANIDDPPVACSQIDMLIERTIDDAARLRQTLWPR